MALKFAHCLVFLLTGAGVAAAAATAGEGPAKAERELERVRLLDGRQYQGLIESEDEVWVHLIEIRQPAGRPTHLVIRMIDRASIGHIARLETADRARLRKQIDRWVSRAKIEAGRMESIRLATVERDGQRRLQYHGAWFTLESTVDEPITRRLIVQTEQIFTAYRQTLPPRVKSQRPLRIIVVGSMEECQAELTRRMIALENRACFVEKENLVLAGSDLARYSAQLAKIKQSHDQLQADLEDLEKRFRKRLREMGEVLQKQNAGRNGISQILNREKRQFELEIEKKREEVKRADRENAQTFKKATGQMLTRLYHEAFHAYLENYVYPHRDYDVPRWLNEGLAVVFEGGVLESDMLRIDAPIPAAARQLKADVTGKEPLKLVQLLSAGPQEFLLPPNTPSSTSDRHYLYCWGLVYYLAFEKRLLGSPALDPYVQSSAKSIPAAARFERLVGMPLAEFEKQWRQSVAKLR